MQGFDFEIIFKKMNDNVVENALSKYKKNPPYMSLHLPFLYGWMKFSKNGKNPIVIDRK
jgi:hypothetical protein